MALPGSTKLSTQFGNNRDMTHALRQQFATVAQERELSNKRLFATAFTLILSLFLCYSSLFYLPAYLSHNSTYRLATEKGAAPTIQTDETENGLERYKDMLVFQRGYLRQGQEVFVSYKTSKNVAMTLNIHQCSPPVILEAIYCRPQKRASIAADSGNLSTMKIRIDRSGFYHFSEDITILSNEIPVEYQVTWKRIS